jgi:hypothetical protein
LKFGFARIPKTYRRYTTENILAAKAIFNLPSLKGLIGENLSSIVHSEFKVLGGQP